jgi:thioesterase domain-containing protein
MKKNVQFSDFTTLVNILRLKAIRQQEELAIGHQTTQCLTAYFNKDEKSVLPDGIVPIRSSGTGTAQFLVHDISGEDIYAQLLARYIDEDIPVYGLVDIPPSATPFRTMYARARRLVRIIRAVQPFGPYRIAGWDFGGNLAYEIATQLIGEDETVSFLGLFDSFNIEKIDLCERSLIDDSTVLLDYVLRIMAEADEPFIEELEMTAKTADLETLVRKCQQEQLLPRKINLEDVKTYLARLKAFYHGITDYHSQPIPIPIHLFRAMDDEDDAAPARGTHLGWDQVLPRSQICVIPVPGTHYSMMSPPHINVLGKSLSNALRQSSVTMKSILVNDGGHLVTIQFGRGGMLYPVFCVPGAGANITDFIDMADALGGQWPIYGLQPRGWDSDHVPHATVPAAARAYLREITEVYPEGPIHLLGHSFGGWVVFEMALGLRAAGRKVASVTLIDPEVPDGKGIHGREYNRTEVFMKLVELSEQRSECSLNLNADDFDGLDYAAQLKLFHGRLMRAGMLSHRSTPEVIRGMVRIFATNLRTAYIPSKTYAGPVRLVLARTATDDEATCRKKHNETAAGWQRFAPDLITWCSPGNHMTVLSPPHVDTLSDWLRTGLCRGAETTY